MLFNEIYGNYYNILAKIIGEAIEGKLNEKTLTTAIVQEGFEESTANIPILLKNGDWPFLYDGYKTPIKNTPTSPLTTLEKRWLKTIANDKRIKLFDFSTEGLEDVLPLYSEDAIKYFDRYDDNDPYENEQYIKNFKTVLNALKEKRRLILRYNSSKGKNLLLECIPQRMEYSPKDDKFRLIASQKGRSCSLNIARIEDCQAGSPIHEEPLRLKKRQMEQLTFELKNERNALERAMLAFSDLQKETQKKEDNKYVVTLFYDKEDETELLIRILSFGPTIKVTSPESFINLIIERLEKQKSCEF